MFIIQYIKDRGMAVAKAMPPIKTRPIHQPTKPITLTVWVSREKKKSTLSYVQNGEE